MLSDLLLDFLLPVFPQPMVVNMTAEQTISNRANFFIVGIPLDAIVSGNSRPHCGANLRTKAGLNFYDAPRFRLIPDFDKKSEEFHGERQRRPSDEFRMGDY